MTRLEVSQLPALNTLVIKEKDGHDFFIAVNNSIIISKDTLAFILKFLIINDYLSHKVLEGILEEYHSYKQL